MNMAFELKATGSRTSRCRKRHSTSGTRNTGSRPRPVSRSTATSTAPTSVSPRRSRRSRSRRSAREWHERFVWALHRGAIPAGRITSNAGAEFHKPATSTINCTVSGTIQDSMHDILSKVHEAGLTLKAGLRDRLRVLDAAAARRVRERRGRLHLRSAVVHGYLRQDVLHGVVRRRPPRRADGHIRRRASRRDGFHPREARGRPTSAVQSVAADHRRVHASGQEGPCRGSSRSRSPQEAEEDGIDLDDPKQIVWREWPNKASYVCRRAGPRRVPGVPHAAGAANVGRDHVVDLRLRGARLRADRPRQRDEQQLVVRGHPCHQSVRRAAPPALRRVLARLDQPHEVRRRAVQRARLFRLGRVPRGRQSLHADARQRRRGQRPAATGATRGDHAQAPPRHGVPGLGSAITLLGMRYGSPDSIKFTEEVSRELATAGWQTGLDLAKEKGARRSCSRSSR